MQKHQCTAHLVHTEETQMVKINPEYPTLVGLIILTWFWHIKPQNYFLILTKRGTKVFLEPQLPTCFTSSERICFCFRCPMDYALPSIKSLIKHWDKSWLIHGIARICKVLLISWARLWPFLPKSHGWTQLVEGTERVKHPTQSVQGFHFRIK